MTIHYGKPYAENPHVRFDEGEVASAATSRCGSLLYKQMTILFAAAVAASGAFVANADITMLYSKQQIPENFHCVAGVFGGMHILGAADCSVEQRWEQFQKLM